MYDYLIVGAGLYGATFAHCMLQRGRRCLVVEKRSHVAGNAYTESVEGIDVHVYGPHIFHTSNQAVWEFVNRFADFHPFVNMPLANYKGELYHLPFNMHTFREMWGVREGQEAMDIIARQRAVLGGAEPRNLEEQAISLVGTDIYEKLVKGYTQKQWGRPCSELPAFIIKRLPVRFTYDNNYFNDIYQGIPVGGYTAMVKRMLRGADVLLGVDYLQHKAALDAKARVVVYTGPIDAYFAYSEGALAYRSLRFEREVLDCTDYQSNAVINYTDAETPYTRCIEHKHFLSTPSKKTVISREFPAEWCMGQEPYYPVNTPQSAALYQRYRAKAQALSNVVFGGRLGEYQYYDMDKVVLAAMQAAERIE